MSYYVIVCHITLYYYDNTNDSNNTNIYIYIYAYIHIHIHIHIYIYIIHKCRYIYIYIYIYRRAPPQARSTPKDQRGAAGKARVGRPDPTLFGGSGGTAAFRSLGTFG